MRKDVFSPCPAGKNEDTGAVERVFTPTPLSGNENINLPLTPKYQTKTRSKATRAFQPVIEYVLTKLSAGQTVSEQDVFENSASRYRRSESITLLREVHRRYRTRTALALRSDGVWVLIPTGVHR